MSVFGNLSMPKPSLSSLPQIPALWADLLLDIILLRSSTKADGINKNVLSIYLLEREITARANEIFSPAGSVSKCAQQPIARVGSVQNQELRTSSESPLEEERI